jgi:hypothetical protein
MPWKRRLARTVRRMSGAPCSPLHAQGGLRAQARCQFGDFAAKIGHVVETKLIKRSIKEFVAVTLTLAFVAPCSLLLPA